MNGFTPTRHIHAYLPYRMKIYTEFDLATSLRLVKFMELNVSEFWVFNFTYINYHYKISKKLW